MPLKIITYNVQRDHSGDIITVVQNLADEHPDALICLQEMTEEIGAKITKVFSKSVHRDENMILVPEGIDLIDSQSLSFGNNTRSFLHAEIQCGEKETPISVITGKLRHGLSFLQRYQALRDMERLFSDAPSLLALDTNHLLPGESRIVLGILQKYGFSYTHHPEGTHDARRSEHAWGKYIPSWLARSQLDRIFASRHFELQESRVLPLTSSDHEPVLATFLKK